MKLKKLLTKSLLVAAGLLTGANGVWAAEVTETYDFGAFITANGVGNLTVSGDNIAQSGTSAKVGSVKVISNLEANGKTLDLNGRFAVDYQYNAGAQIRFMWRSSSNAYQHGLAGQWNNKGTADPQGAARFSILNLKEGDKITFTYAKQSGKAADPYTCSASQLTDIAADAALASGTTYTVAADGNVDLYFTNNNFAISKIVIVTTGTETIDSKPEVAITGANGGDRIISITSSKTNAGSDTKTYYTKDGSTPTSTSTEYKDAFTLTAADADEEGKVTIKAITYKAGDTSVASEVTEYVVTGVGTTLKLNAPTITFAGFTVNNGYFSPTYTFASNQGNIAGAPTATITYSLNDGTATEGTSLTLAEAGSLTVTVSAEGYESNSTTQDVIGGYFVKSYDFDAINDVTMNETVDWNSGGNATSVNGVGWSFATLSDNCTYTLREDINLTSFVYARATTANTKQGFYVRAGTGKIEFGLNDGEYIVFTTLGNPVLANSEARSQSFGQYANVRAINIYTPVSVIGNLDYSSGYRSAFSSDIVVANNSAKKVTFKNHGSGTGTEYYKNWVLDINYGGSLATTLRSDWYAFDKGQLVYPYTFSTDGGATLGTGNVWANWFTDNAESDVELTLSNVNGKLYVIGTMTKDNDVYYVNYVYGDGTQTGDFTLNLSVDHSWIEIESIEDAETTTTFVHPVAVTTTLDAAGWATYANNLYPIDAANATNGTAYAATADAAKLSVKLNELNVAVPANTGIVLNGKSNGTVTLPIADAAEAVSTGLEVNVAGTTFTAESDYTYFGMKKNADKLTFATFDPSTVAIPANKAYLKVLTSSLPKDESPARLTVTFDDDETTGISTVAAQGEQSEAIFNLQGQRVSQAQKGLYIVNGKKVIKK